MGDHLGCGGEYDPPCSRGPVYRQDPATGEVDVVARDPLEDKQTLRERAATLMAGIVDMGADIVRFQEEEAWPKSRIGRIVIDNLWQP